MKYLVLCIFKPDASGLPTGLDPGVSVVEANGLAAAVTLWSQPEQPPDVVRLLSYERAVAEIHASRAVIPLRFGCIVEGETGILALLQSHRAEYHQLLAQWEDLTEMGLRVLRDSRADSETRAGTRGSTEATQYLADLRERHPGLTPADQQCAASIMERLRGLYRGARQEARPTAQGRLISLYFLVPRASIDDFRKMACGMQLPSHTKLMLSGPWPPYNFASPRQDNGDLSSYHPIDDRIRAPRAYSRNRGKRATDRIPYYPVVARGSTGQASSNKETATANSGRTPGPQPATIQADQIKVTD